MTNIIWFRNDLRIQNNAALKRAIDASSDLEALYILPENSDLYIGEAAKWYLQKSLIDLESNLQKLGITINFYIGDAATIFAERTKNNNALQIFCNQSFNPLQIEIDKAVFKTLTAPSALNYVGSDMLVNPNNIKNASGGHYKRFTPFWNKLQQHISLQTQDKCLFDIALKTIFKPIKKTTQLSDLNLLSKNKWYDKFENHWRAGEKNALKRFNEFMENDIVHYDTRRDNLEQDQTSKLSAYINFGELSVTYLHKTLNQYLHTCDQSCELSVYKFIEQLAWREFAKYSLYYNSDSYLKSIYSYCDSDVLWNGDDILFELWKKSKTGIDIIDSAMNQLWEEGTMHNRARMFSASFLTKNLGIHWVKGAQWFWHTLIDADLAANTMGWQWVAGTAPYSSQFSRVFNPELQAKKFDKNEKYTHKYLPKYSNIKPIVSIKESSSQAKHRYRQLQLLQKENQE